MIRRRTTTYWMASLIVFVLLMTIMFSDAVYASENRKHGFQHHNNTGRQESNMTMREVMQQLNVKLNHLSTAIILEEYKAIEYNARAIATHPTPRKSELQRIFSTPGVNAEKFKACDQAVHNLAGQLATHAARKNMSAILATYHDMISKTVACHRNFKKKAAAHNISK